MELCREGKNTKRVIWKQLLGGKCPDDTNNKRKYGINGENPMTITKINGDVYFTIIGNSPVPLDTVTSWNIKVLKLKKNSIYVSVTPFDINQNEYICNNIAGILIVILKHYILDLL